MDREQKVAKFRALLDQFVEVGSTKEDIVAQAKNVLQTHYALKNGHSMICHGDSGQRTASRLLSLICKGRGLEAISGATYRTEDFLGSGLAVGRPLRELVEKEVLMYVRHKELEQFVVCPKALCLKTPKNKRLPAWGNMDSLLGDFVGMI